WAVSRALGRRSRSIGHGLAERVDASARARIQESSVGAGLERPVFIPCESLQSFQWTPSTSPSSSRAGVPRARWPRSTGVRGMLLDNKPSARVVDALKRALRPGAKASVL